MSRNTETPRIAYFVVPSDDHDDLAAAGDEDGFDDLDYAVESMIDLARKPGFEGPWTIVKPLCRADNGKILQWHQLSHSEIANAAERATGYTVLESDDDESAVSGGDGSDVIGYISGDWAAEYRGAQ